MKKHSDNELEEMIDTLKKIVISVIGEEHFYSEYQTVRFSSYFEYYEDEPKENPCVLLLLHEYNNFSCDIISDKIELMGFVIEHIDFNTIGFYLADNESQLANDFRDYFEWQWICELIKPDYSALYEEIFDRFNKKPDDAL